MDSKLSERNDLEHKGIEHMKTAIGDDTQIETDCWAMPGKTTKGTKARVALYEFAVRGKYSILEVKLVIGSVPVRVGPLLTARPSVTAYAVLLMWIIGNGTGGVDYSFGGTARLFGM